MWDVFRHALLPFSSAPRLFTQRIKTNEPNSLLAAAQYFADPAACNQYMRRIKWPDGKITCPKCSGANIGDIATRHILQCRDCGKQFSYKVGTIFEDSPLGLDKWFTAVWSVANTKNGISSHELGRALGVTQKTAWFMTHRIREAMTWRKCQDGGLPTDF